MNADINLAQLHGTVRTLCGLGWYLFPLAPGKKTPATPNGHKDATTDLSVALRLFDNGRLNIGIATGPSRLVVLDGDGEAGNVWLADARETCGIPRTFTVRTRAGGFHYYFEAPPGIEIKCSASRIAPGIDIRGEGGYVVGPTSWVDADEKGPAGWYKVTDDSPVAPLPAWLEPKLRQLSAPKRTTVSRHAPVRPETPRNIALLCDQLRFITADCSYECYRCIVWAILSSGWECAADIARWWSQTAPHRFDEKTFDNLIRYFDPSRPDCPSFGSIVYAARAGGWNG